MAANINRILPKRRTQSPLQAGRHAVITGGSSGLGLALAEELARRHLQVTLIARDRERLDAAGDGFAPQCQEPWCASIRST